MRQIKGNNRANGEERTRVRIGAYWSGNGYERSDGIKMGRLVVLTKKKSPFLKIIWYSLGKKLRAFRISGMLSFNRHKKEFQI